MAKMDLSGLGDMKAKMEADAKKEIDDRLDIWGTEKKRLTHRLPVNKNGNATKKFDIMPWTIWWFHAGENIGFESGAHIGNDGEHSFTRPCIVVSKLQSLVDSNHSLITIIPMSSKSSNVGINEKYMHKLEAELYGKKGNYQGIKIDSYVLCNQIKTIDTKRLVTMIHRRIEDDDIKEINGKIIKCLDLLLQNGDKKV